MTRIACAQLAPVLGDVTGNIEMSTAAISEAVSAGAQIVVLPESCPDMKMSFPFLGEYVYT